jgi:hypothetical protein
MQWLFLSCHNYWIVCRFVRDDNHPYLAYSPEFSIENSSEPFRAFLGAILSVVKGVPVESSAYNSDMEFDTIKEKANKGPLPEHDIDDGSESYQGSSGGGAATGRPMTRAHGRHENTEFDLMVRAFPCRYLSLGLLITLRLLHLPPNRLNTRKYGCIFIP